MKILVTGSAGFIGSWVADRLKKEGHDVLGLDNLSGGFVSNTTGHTFIPCELADKWNVERKVARFKPEVLYHLAASAREIGSLFEPAKSTQDNAMAYTNTLNSCIKHGLKKVVLFSSMAVYGEQQAPFTEEMEKCPADIYGFNKAFMEDITQFLSKIHGFTWTIIRPHNVIGPRQNLSDKYRNVFAIWMNKIMRGDKEIFVFGDGCQMRAFSPVEFSLPCYVRCLQDYTDGRIYNIGGEHPITLNEAAEMCLEVMGATGKVKIRHLPARPQEVKLAFCDSSRSIEELGYQETRGLFECLVDMATWAKKLGPQEWNEDKLELANSLTPEVWR